MSLSYIAFYKLTSHLEATGNINFPGKMKRQFKTATAHNILGGSFKWLHDQH